MSAALLCLVVAISDGDTLKARCGEPGSYQQITVRISAIDAPEKGQDFGNVSRQHLAALCFQQVGGITPRGTDRYRRTIADVECRGKDVAQEQVRAGLAWYYVKYGKGYEHLAQVEQQARDAGRGLWSINAVAPWDWRRRGVQTP
ncbi:thermonuclease family protein [Hydrogenophaga sp. 2FB]|uniref:thermonuclease family protein n=1 Tax=Hydrogenophaga sp. 2FB TaxID=2502187 RepID=UPI00207BCD99|nr:thermonuclease family protein [Hydrogenophaga sp. 2FB]